MTGEILKPVAVLIAWSMVMWAWMVAVRMPALKRAGIDVRSITGSKPGQLDGILPAKAQWPAHNYIHLMEQPTVFYAVALTLAIVGAGGGVSAALAWGYVGFRIVHSFVQVTANRIAVRFALFFLSSLCLIALAIIALVAVFAL